MKTKRTLLLVNRIHTKPIVTHIERLRLSKREQEMEMKCAFDLIRHGQFIDF